MANNFAKERTINTSNESEDMCLHWTFLASLFSTYQAAEIGLGISLFCSIPFKRKTSGKGEKRSS